MGEKKESGRRQVDAGRTEKIKEKGGEEILKKGKKGREKEKYFHQY